MREGRVARIRALPLPQCDGEQKFLAAYPLSELDHDKILPTLAKKYFDCN